jgi:DNA-binding CsgD family transcriptional regulator
MSGDNYDKYFEILNADDTDAFASGLGRFAAALGFPLFNATAVNGLGTGFNSVCRVVSNSPEAWKDHAADADDNRRDPIFKVIKLGSPPFVYDQGFYVRHGASDLWEKQAPFGYRTGITAPVHLPGGRLFLLGFDREEPLPTDRHQLMKMLGDIQLLTTFVQDRGRQLLLPNEGGSLVSDAEGGTLTTREIDVLCWAASGKSAWETAQILNISDNTVNKYITSAAAKLGCTGKTHAVARAISKGLLLL